MSDHRSIKETFQKAKQGISVISPHSMPIFGETAHFPQLNNPMISNEILGQSCDEQGLVELEPPNLVQSNKSNKSNGYYQTLGIPNEEFLSDDEKLQSMIDKYDYVSLFCKEKFVACATKSKSCSLCNDSGYIAVEKVKEDLNRRFRVYYRKNYKKLIEYFQAKYKIEIDSFEQLMETTQQIVELDQNRKFIFRCHYCKQFFKNEYNVYLKNQKRYCHTCAWEIRHENLDKLEFNEQNGIIPAQSPFFPMPKLNSQSDDVDQQFI